MQVVASATTFASLTAPVQKILETFFLVETFTCYNVLFFQDLFDCSDWAASSLSAVTRGARVMSVESAPAAMKSTAVPHCGTFGPAGRLPRSAERVTVVALRQALYFLSTGVLGLELLTGSGWVADVFYGGVLVAAVATSTLLSRRSGATAG